MNKGMPSSDRLGLTRFKILLQKLEPEVAWRTRQGSELFYRHYPALSEDLIILFHGIGSDSRYLASLASEFSKNNSARVITPDFRCHGRSLSLSDQIAREQLEEDLLELIVHLRTHYSVKRVFLGGHSLGGGFALRAARRLEIPLLGGVFALAPYLPIDWSMHAFDWAGWLKLHSDGGLTVQFPKVLQTGREKLNYSAAYLEAVSVQTEDIKGLSRLELPSQVFLGAKDPLWSTEELVSYLLKIAPSLKVKVLPEADHFSLVMSQSEVVSIVSELKSNLTLF